MFRAVLILLTLLLPWGRPSEFRKYRERERMREELQRKVEQLEKLKRPAPTRTFNWTCFETHEVLPAEPVVCTTIRLATHSDEPAIVELNAVVQRLHASYDPLLFKQPVLDELADWFRGFLSKNNSQIWVAEEAGNAIGYACVSFQERPANPFCRNRRYLEIENISVRPDDQRRGVGRQLVEHVLRTAAKDDICDVELSCWCFNTGAQEAFQRLGFEPRWVRFRQVVSPLPDSSEASPKSP